MALGWRVWQRQRVSSEHHRCSGGEIERPGGDGVEPYRQNQPRNDPTESAHESNLAELRFRIREVAEAEHIGECERGHAGDAVSEHDAEERPIGDCRIRVRPLMSLAPPTGHRHQPRHEQMQHGEEPLGGDEAIREQAGEERSNESTNRECRINPRCLNGGKRQPCRFRCTPEILRQSDHPSAEREVLQEHHPHESGDEIGKSIQAGSHGHSE